MQRANWSNWAGSRGPLLRQIEGHGNFQGLWCVNLFRRRNPITDARLLRSLFCQLHRLLLRLVHESYEPGQVLKRSFEIELVELGGVN